MKQSLGLIGLYLRGSAAGKLISSNIAVGVK
jgi:hypothetical protein